MANTKRSHGTFAPKSGKMQLTDLDKAILAQLPPIGAKRGKYLPDARTVAQIKKALADSELTSDLIGGRLRLMAAVGLVASTPLPGSSSRGLGWQKK